MKITLGKINDKQAKKLGFDDVRHLISEFGNWSCWKDWIYQNRIKIMNEKQIDLCLEIENIIQRTECINDEEVVEVLKLLAEKYSPMEKTS